MVKSFGEEEVNTLFHIPTTASSSLNSDNHTDLHKDRCIKETNSICTVTLSDVCEVPSTVSPSINEDAGICMEILGHNGKINSDLYSDSNCTVTNNKIDLSSTPIIVTRETNEFGGISSHVCTEPLVLDDTRHLNHAVRMTDSPHHGAFSDAQSEHSSDSGKGGSDIQPSSELPNPKGDEYSLIYEFEIPQELCGRLIGRQGKHVKYIKNCSNASVLIKRHPFSKDFKLCGVEGTSEEIRNALQLIRKRFPTSRFSSLTLAQVNIPITHGVPIPHTLQLHLPEGVSCDVILSSMVNAGHFFLQQPTHPTYTSLSRLDQCMVTCYAQTETPTLPYPVEAGVICAAPVMDGWFRAQIVHVYDGMEECDVKFVDYGGYSCLPVASLRQIRSDFMTLPFQAAEFYLASVKPVDEELGWSVEACAAFEEMAQGHILQALIVAFADDGIPCVHLYRVQGVSVVFINRELVNQGLASWINLQV
ncbi:A-kinase anchor protein 1, mitochondrial-like [Limulus polyphemus]|uniref:A-kinase anchor protein 1, mitochondrial-like n=1 Tax=Limulus polyphemus TaxID=6850 RepID=A0ABM1B5Z9_LIMPO|nr:A-kinase anchor protein 1, mitochondrial-like [Limulus polyphemus]XP_022242770.1 A-kinase anchor protein 1, mitochondrial-like [Limulus polyphemus]